MSELKQHLDLMAEMIQRVQTTPSGYGYSSIYEYVAKNGREMVSRPLTREQTQYIRRATRGQKFPIKQCYGNAQECLLKNQEDARLAYYEGYATTGFLPVLHGWLVLDGECLIDLTWRRRSEKPLRGRLDRTRIFGEIPEGYAYIGLKVADRNEIFQRAMRLGAWCSFLDDWEQGYPLLRADSSLEACNP